MKIKVRKMLTAAVLVAFGFGLGFFVAPTDAQSTNCIVGDGDKKAFLYCAGTYEFMSSPRSNTAITGCKIKEWSIGTATVRSAIVTVIKGY